MTRFTLGVQATLLLPSSDAHADDAQALSAAAASYGLQFAFAAGDGPTQFTIEPAPGQSPLSLGAMVTRIAEMLKIDAIADVSKLTSTSPWKEILSVEIAPYLTVAIGDAPAVQLLVQLYRDNVYGIRLGGAYGPITVEPNFTVYDLIVGYDKAKGGLDVRARVNFAEQKSARAARLAAAGDATPAGEPDGKTAIVSYPFPMPSQGGSNFQVKYFGLGQRFGPTVDLKADDPLARMFDELEKNFTTNDPKQLLDTLAGYYDPARDWFVAAHLVVRGWELRAVFNDPVLYGLEITCAVDQFKGLLLEILYQKLGPHLGVYYGALTMPERYRQINLGAVALTLPSFKIWIYTNGDFKVSVGWPLGENSIGIQVYVFTGGGGFYFGKLRSGDNPASGAQALRERGSSALANVTSYNPVVVFGLAAWFGVGRSISAGPFSASLSLTAQGTFQGILAWESAAAGGNVSKQPDYFWFAATVGIVGQLQGEVDLSVVKLSILVRLSVVAGIAFETGYGTEINIVARVDAQARLKILFITISVGFHTTISTSFTITQGAAPASLAGPQNPAFHGMNDWGARGLEHLEQQLLAHQHRLLAAAGSRTLFAPLPIAPAQAVPVALSFLLQPAAVYAGAVGTLAGVATLIIAAPADAASPTPTDLEKLAAALASWLLRTWSDGTGTWAAVMANLREGRARAPDHWSARLDSFLATELAFTINPLDLAGSTGQESEQSWALFPMFDALQMSWTGHDAPLVFADYARTYPNYPQVVEEYFAALSLNGQMANPDARGEARFGILAPAGGGAPQGPSLTALIFGDYFLTLGRQMARSLADKEQAANAPAGLPDTALVRTLGGLTSRYLMNGMRLPDPATTPPAQVDVDLATLDIAPGYALNGQQFAVQSDADASQPVAATLSRAAAAGPLGAAFRFAGDAEGVTSTMPVQSVPPAPTPSWTRAGELAAASASIAIAPIAAVHAGPVWYAARERLPWTGPGGPDRFVAPLPPAVLRELARQTLTLTVQAAPPNTPDAPAQTVAPALMIQTPIHLVRRPVQANVTTAAGPVSPYYADIYRIAGTDEETRERIRAALAAAALTGATVTVLYDAKTTGYQSDAIDLANEPLVLAKTNLSTSSQPASPNLPLHLLRNSVPLGPTCTLFPDPAKRQDPESQRRLEALLQLVWEVSVVHSDGFFLRYANAGGGSFPTSIFTPKGQPDSADGIPAGDTATVTLLVTFPSSTRFERWHNAFVFAPAESLDGTLYLGVADEHGKALQQFQPSYPAGCVGFEAQWALAHLLTRESGSLFDADWVAALYHLLQFRVDGQASGSARRFDTSLWSLALSPSCDSAADHADAPERPAQLNAAAQTYRQVVPVYRFIDGAGAAPNPYAAVGSRPNLVFRLNDIFGNALEGDSFATGFEVLYNDPLVPPNEWPGVRIAYRFAPSTLTLALLFDPALVIRASAQPARPDDDSGNQQVQAALWKYATIAAQLSDPNVSVELTQSVLPSRGGVVGDGGAIKKSLAAFAAAVVEQLTSPPGGIAQKVPLELPIAIDPADLATRTDDIFPVSATLTFARPKALVDPQALDGAPRTLCVAMPLAADLDPPPQGTRRAQFRAQSTGDQPPADVGLAYFASQFEAAFAGFDGAKGCARLAARTDTADLANDATASLWAVRMSATKGMGIHVGFPKTGATCYALMPLSTKLMNGPAEVPTYAPNTLAPSYASQTFTGVDLDGWAQVFLAAMDEVLSPATAVAIAALDSGSYQALMEAKAQLAQALAKGVVPTFKPESGGDLALAQDQFEQSVLASLSSAYAVSSVVQVPAQVAAAEPIAPGSATPRFFGSVTHVGATSADAIAAPGYTIGGAKLPIETSPKEGSFLTFLVTVAQPGRDAHLTLDLQYQARFVEHLLDSSEASHGYTPSEWLRFVRELPSDPLTMPLGEVNVPVPLRAFPASPVLQGHRAQQVPAVAAASAGDTTLRWNYGATLAQPEQNAQDELWVSVAYNLPIEGPVPLTQRSELGTIEAVFEALASFMQAWPVLRPYIGALPQSVFQPGVSAPTSAQVLAALLQQVQLVTRAWGALRGITDRSGQLLFPRTLQAPPPPVQDEYVINFEHAYDGQGILWVSAKGEASAGGGCAGSGIIWPLINGQPRNDDVTRAGPSACWYRASYQYAPSATLELTWPKLDVANRQTARSAWWTVRNANLSTSEGVTTNEALIYRTGVVSFASPVVPYLTVPPRQFDSGATLAGALENALQLFDFASAAAKERLLKVALTYRYQMGAPAGGGTPLWSDIPVLLAAGVELATDTTGSGTTVTLAQLAQKLAADVQAWFGIVAPSTDTAMLCLNVVLFANVNDAQLPIVQAPDLEITVPRGWWPT
jgi:hypothetical protein